MKILIADDEPDVLTLVQLVLGPTGHELITAETGEETLAQVVLHRPDLLILDLLMPRGHGFGVLKQIRQNPEFHDLKVLVLSSKGYAEDRRRALQEGADRYLTKPFEAEQLVRDVEELLGGASDKVTSDK
jgi:DNA-binding response OmpR family regulator